MKNVNQHYYRLHSILFLCILLAYALPLLVLGVLRSAFDIVLPILAVITLFFLPPTIYYFGQWYYYGHVQLSNEQTVSLNDIVSHWSRLVAFKVTLHIDGTEKTFVTKAVFAISPMSRLSLERYLHKPVKVGYDPSRDEAIIIG